MKTIKTIKFQANLVREHGMSPRAEKLGAFDNEMELRINDEGTKGCVVWNYQRSNGSGADETVIGLWFKDKVLADYDGVFNMPREAQELIESAGYTLGEGM